MRGWYFATYAAQRNGQQHDRASQGQPLGRDVPAQLVVELLSSLP
jgi:hypothetical protein